MKTSTSPAFALGARDGNETSAQEIALWRLYLLRAGYLLIAVGMGMEKVPAFLHHRPWEVAWKATWLLPVITGGERRRCSTRKVTENRSPRSCPGRAGAYGNGYLQSLILQQPHRTLNMRSAIRAVEWSRDYRIGRVDNLT